MPASFKSVPRIVSGRFVEIKPSRGEIAISLLMPLYRQGSFIASAIRSALSQRDVVAEIIISDDASGDGTFGQAMAVLEDFPGRDDLPHRIVVRRGTKRLWRDHLPLLAERASAGIVCQAHGDDISHPERCQRILDAFSSNPAVTLVTSREKLFSATVSGNFSKGISADRRLPGVLDARRILDGGSFLDGALLAWKKSALRAFSRLDTSFTPAAHDRILAFRAALAGRVLVLPQLLVMRRLHRDQASQLLYQEPYRNSDFSLSVMKMSMLQAMSSDLEKAMSLGMIPVEIKLELESAILELEQTFQQRMLASYKLYTRAGKCISWVESAELRKLKKGFSGWVFLHLKMIAARLRRSH